MTVEQKVANLTTSVDQLTDAVNVKKQTLDASVADSTAARDASQAARDTAGQHKDSAATSATQASNTATSISGFDLKAIAQTKADTAVDVFVYDTSQDSDGGAWRHRTQDTSWYNEPLNTLTRGGRREFPAVAVIVAEADKVTIYDGDDPALPMWMMFNKAPSGLNFLGTSNPSYPVEKIKAVNGILATVMSKSGGLANFISDNGQYLSTSGSNIITPISERGQSCSTVPNGTNLGGVDANDVAMTVLPDAPTDQATGLPVPTIAVATDGGVSVIKDDGTVFNPSFAGYENGPFSLNDGFSLVANSREAAPALSTFRGESEVIYNSGGDYASIHTLDVRNETNIRLKDLRRSNYFNRFGGISRIMVDKADFGRSLAAFQTPTYNTGWMPGDIKGAFLSDTDDTDLVGSELVTNGTFDTDLTGWTGDAIYDAGTAKLDYDAVGSNADLQQTVTGLTAGKRYLVTWSQTLSGTGTQRTRRRFRNAQNNGDLSFGYNNGSGEFSIRITADGDQFFFRLWVENAGTVANVDDVSVKEVDADRSVNNNGLIVNGTVTREPVATGADLVAYSGFSASNYLEQPYNPDLDFGTGDFCVMGWATASASSDYLLSRQTAGTTNTSGFFLYQNGGSSLSGDLIYRSYEGAANTQVTVGTLTDKLQHFAVVRKSGVTSTYMNGVFQNSVADTRNVSSTDAKLFVGCRANLSNAYLNGKAALIRISATAPTAEQIYKIYNDEKFLFQENAACTLYGTSDAVTALAHDEVTDLLHVGTSAGRSVFQGLRRVENTTDAVGKAISASNGLIVED